MTEPMFKTMMLELQEALLRLDLFLYDKLQDPANKDPLKFLITWNEYQKIKRYVNLCIMQVLQGCPSFSWKWLHENKLLLAHDYEIFDELKEFADQAPKKSASQTLQEIVSAFNINNVGSPV